MASKNWTLKTPVTGKIIELTSGSDVLIEGSSYNFVLPTDHGVTINQIDFTYRASNGSKTEFSFEEFIKSFSLPTSKNGNFINIKSASKLLTLT